MTENERREFLKAAGASLAGVVGMGVLGCGTSGPTEIRNPTRAELVERLEKLAKSEPPKDLMVSPSCYDMAGPTFVYKPCPTCERTMQVGEKDEILRAYHVPLKRIQDQGVDVKLIIPEHCPECGFGLFLCGMTQEQRWERLPKEEWEARQIQLEIKYPDLREPVRVKLDSTLDLEMMALFLQGKDRIDKGQRGEEALKNDVERLEELFGIKEKKREELIERLKQLGEEEQPKEIMHGADCYSVYFPPDLPPFTLP